jgi:L-alanine-DL-glutamate epimerase-like enolase superfamily enzyme
VPQRPDAANTFRFIAATMRIVGVDVLEFRRELDGHIWNPAFRWHERRAPLLVLETDEGLTGIGEAWSRQSQINLVLDALADHVAPALLGADPTVRAPIARRLSVHAQYAEPWVGPAAESAVDIALWDLTAQAARQPLWRALGGSDGRTPVYASGGLYRDSATPTDLEREFDACIGLGFTAAKMKIGALSLEGDLERVHCVRRATGEAVLWVDAVNQLNRGAAPEWCRALARAGVAAIQAPLPSDDVVGMAEINASILPVIASEAEHREDAFRALLDANAVTYLQYCVGLCGGFTGALQIDRVAKAYGVKSTPQCFSTAVLQAASLHLGAACDNVVAVEFHRFHDHLAAALPPAMKRVESGFVHLDDAPGLGVSPPELGEQPGGGAVRLHRRLMLTSQASHA